MRVITGAIASIICTVRVMEPVFPAASIFVYVRIYVPSAQVFTVPLATSVPDPSTLSNQFAPASI